MKLKAFIPAILWAIAILVLTLTPGNYIPEAPWNIFQFDKLVHLFIFAVQVYLFLFGLIKSGYKVTPLIIAITFFSCLAYGIAIELIQDYVPGRQSSAADVIANATGSVVGYGVFYLYRRIKKHS